MTEQHPLQGAQHAHTTCDMMVMRAFCVVVSVIVWL